MVARVIGNLPPQLFAQCSVAMRKRESKLVTIFGSLAQLSHTKHYERDVESRLESIPHVDTRRAGLSLPRTSCRGAVCVYS